VLNFLALTHQLPQWRAKRAERRRERLIGDFDINVTFLMTRKDNRRRQVSTQARPKDLPPYKGKIVQVTRNVYAGKELVKRRHSKN